MAMTLSSRWWAVALRGVAAILFGVITFVDPGVSLLALVILFGSWAIVDGSFNIASALRGRRDEKPWGALLLEGVAGIAAGVLAIMWPGITALVLLWLIATWAIVTGVAEIVAAIRLRKSVRGEWLLALAGVLSIAFGVLLFLRPGAGALAITLWIGAYAIVFGALMLALSFRLRAWGRKPERRVPTGGVPAGGVPTPA
jgi:uncharacterized membrane protein HdeD (DUF308 family)